jgi:hypothetical protein
MWRNKYRMRRYLENISNDTLKLRARDIVNNMTEIKRHKKPLIGPLALSEEMAEWMRLFTHVTEEAYMRSLNYSEFMYSDVVLSPLNFLDTEDPIVVKANKALRSLDLPSGDYLYKYGKLKYLIPAMNTEFLRVSPASLYNDPSLNYAIQDDELNLCINPLLSEVKLEAFDRKTGKSKGQIKPKELTYTIFSKTNYYVFCLSRILTPRLFLDFDKADGCLVIRNPNEFVELVLSSFEKTIEGWDGFSDIVEYVDPFNCKTNDIDIFLSKHFRYAYQKEYRLIWLPNDFKHELEPVIIKVPNLTKYCYLIDLSKY